MKNMQLLVVFTFIHHTSENLGNIFHYKGRDICKIHELTSIVFYNISLLFSKNFAFYLVRFGLTFSTKPLCQMLLRPTFQCDSSA